MKNNECGTVANWNWVIISLTVLAICTLLVLYMPSLSEFDWGILKAVQRALSPYPKYIPIFFSEFGRDYNMLWPQIAACCALLANQRYLKAFLLVFFTQASFVLTGFMKDFICRERPCGDAYPGFSFPSGHSSTTMCFLGICIYLVMRYVGNKFIRYSLAVMFGVYIFMVGLSRLWLNHHFLTDVIGGMFLGVLLVNLYIITSKFFAKG